MNDDFAVCNPISFDIAFRNLLPQEVEANADANPERVTQGVMNVSGSTTLSGLTFSFIR